MLESLVASILNRILGSYVENFDPRQLQIGLLSGDVKLAGLKMKRGALDHLQLPLNIVNGHIGSLVLQIPYSNLKSKPVKVFIEDVFLIAKPDMDHEEEGQRRREQAAKIEKLQLWELSSERAMVRVSTNSSAESEAELQKQKNFTSSLVSKIIENVQVTIRNIHVRFEDLETGVALGATLGELSAISTNKNWEPAFIADVGSTTHKLATLDSLAFYIDPEVSTPFSTPASREERALLLEEFKALIFDSIGATDILRPINGQGFITMNKNPESEQVPRIKADLKFEELSINLDREQYLDALRLTDRFQKYFNSLKYRRLRPKLAVKEDPLAWFRYAAKTVLDGVKEKRRHWSWDYIQKHINDQKKYVELYKQWYRSRSSDREFTSEDRCAFNSIETEYSYEQLLFFRSLAKKQLVHERADVRNKPQACQSWSKWLWGSKPAGNQEQAAAKQIELEKSNNSVETAAPIEITDQDRQELLDVLDVSSFSDDATSQVLLAVEFSLRSAGIWLKFGQKALASAGFENVKTTFVNRPCSSSLEMSVAKFEVSDLTRKNQFSDIIRVQDMLRQSSEEPFLWFLFEHHPADRKADSNLTLKSQSVVIVHNARLLESVMAFFAAPPDQGDTVDAILLAANKTVEGLREQTRLGLEYALENHKTMNLQLDIKAPTIVVPLDTDDADSAALVLDVGSLQVASDLVPQNVLSEVKSKQALKYSEKDWKRLESLMYDRFTVKLCDTQILLGERMSDITDSIKHNSSRLHFLDKATLKFLLEQSIVPRNHNLTRTRISINLPSLRATLADVQYMLFVKIMAAATPTSSDAESYGTSRGFVPRHDSKKAPENVGDLDSEESAGKVSKPTITNELASNSKPHRLFEFLFTVNEVQFLVVKGWHGKPLIDMCLHEVKFSNWSIRGLPDEILGAELSVGDLLITDHLNTSGPSELRKVAESAGHEYDASSITALFHVKFRKSACGDVDVNVFLAAIRFNLDPNTVLSIYDYVMSTFTSPSDSRSPSPPISRGEQGHAIASFPSTDVSNKGLIPQGVDAAMDSKRIIVKLTMQGVSAKLVENHEIIAIVSMEQAELYVDMQDYMKVKFDLGTVSLVDNEQNSIMSIEGKDNLVDFRYETEPVPEDPNATQPPSLVFLHMGRVKLQIIEEPLTRLASFLSTFTAMKAVYDQARMMNFNQTIQVEPGMFKFDVNISTPIIIWPRGSDWIRLDLGEVYVGNVFQGTANIVKAGIRNVQISSLIDGTEQQIVPKTDLEVKMFHVPSSDDILLPLMHLKAALTPVHINSSEHQYGLILRFMESLSKISAGAASASIGMDEVGDLRRKLAKEKQIEETQASFWWGENFSVALGGDSNSDEFAARRPKFRFDFDAPLLDITLDFEKKALSRMAIESVCMEIDIDKDSTLEANFYLRSIGVDDLSNGSNNKFTQIVPPVRNDGQQLMGRMVKRIEQPYSLDCSIDSPQVILALGYLNSLKKFLEYEKPTLQNTEEPFEAEDDNELETSGSLSERDQLGYINESEVSSVALPEISSGSHAPDASLLREKPPSPHISVNITDMYLTVLEDESNENSEALVFKIEQVILNSGETSTFSLSKVGIFLTQMQSFEKSRLRVLDDFNVTVSIDNSESTSNYLLTNIQANIDPLVVRISLREIRLILGILQKASEISSLGYDTEDSKKLPSSARKSTNFFADDYRKADKIRKNTPALALPQGSGHNLSRNSIGRGSNDSMLMEVTRVLAEQLIAQFDGLRLVLIDPLHQLPMIDFCIKPFNLIAKNWSDSLVVSARAELYANVHSFTKSAWEPLIDTMEIGLTATTNTFEVISSTVADLEFSLETIELGHDIKSYFDDSNKYSTSRVDSDEGLPYRIINSTGMPITVWADSENSKSRRRKIADSEEIGWSFHEWRELRENLNTTDQDNTVGVEFHAEEFGMLRSVLVNRVGEYLYPLENGDLTLRVLFEIWVENHLKYIKIRSTELVKNHTETDLEMLVVGHGHQITLQLPAGSHVALPLSLIDSHLAIRPKGNTQWPNQSLYWKDLVSENKLTIKCSDEYFLSVKADIPETPLSHSYPYLTINLTAPFRVINNLTQEIRLKLYSRETRRESSEHLAKAGRILLHDYSSDALLLLRVDVPSYTCNKYAVINTGSKYHAEFHLEDTVEISQNHQRLQLNLKYVDLPEGEGRAIVIYSPYVILNSCKDQIILSGRRSKITCEPGASKLWSSQHLNSQNLNERASVATSDSQPSAPISLDASGSTSEIALVSKDRQRDLYLGVMVTQGVGRYVDTKIISISPRFILCNSTDRPLCFREPGGKQNMQADAGDRIPAGFMWSMAEKEMCVKFADSENAEWSSSFTMMNVGTNYLRLGVRGQATVLIKVEVILEGASFFVHFFKSPSWPYSVRNFTDTEFIFYQSDPLVDEDGAEMDGHSVKEFTPVTYRLPPKSAMPYSWDFPAAKVKQLVISTAAQPPRPPQHPPALLLRPSDPSTQHESENDERFDSRQFSGAQSSFARSSASPEISEITTQSGASAKSSKNRHGHRVKRRYVRLAEIGELPPANFGGDIIVDISVIADGPQQALVIAPHSPEASNYDLRTNTVKSDVIAEADSLEAKTGKTLKLDLKGIGMSFITHNAQELIYVTLRNVKAEYHMSDALEMMTLQVQWIQVDNTLPGSNDFPVIIYPTVLPKAAEELAAHPCFSTSITRVPDDSYGLMYIKHATLLLQEMTIEADEDFLLALVAMVISLVTRKAPENPHHEYYQPLINDDSALCEDEITIPQPSTDAKAGDIYFEQLHLQPIQLNLSFMRTGSLSTASIFKDNNVAGSLAFLIDALTLTIGNINDAPVKFNALLVDNVRTEISTLSKMIQVHYQQEFLYQIHKIVGSADIIGNPVGLFNNISSGIIDLFYEPYLGYTLNDRPQEFGIGLAKGGLSFMKKSVFGLSDSVSKVTGALSKGLAVMTLDPRYQNKQRGRRMRNRPRHAVHGFKYGVESLYESVSSGFMGLAEAPMQGAVTNGGAGFFRGLGVGLVGLPTKTTIGLLDFASNLTEGIRNTTTVFDAHEISRIRLPRVVSHDGTIKPYNVRESVGQMILHSVKDNRYAKDRYLAHSNITRNKAVIVSMERVLVASINDMNLEWSLTYDQVDSITLEDTGIVTTLLGGVHGPFIPLSEEYARRHIYKSIGKGVDEYNKRKITMGL